MNPSVTLTVIQGPLTGRVLTFLAPDTCLLGRDADCHLVVPDDADHRRVSRHQCRLEIVPPLIRLRDLQSRNGTRVGDRVVSAHVNRAGEIPGELELRHGDEIYLGLTVLRVGIVTGTSVPPTEEENFDVPAVCDRCWCDVPEAHRIAWSVGDGTYLCPACRGRIGEVACPRCGKPVPLAPLRPGELLCAGCQANAAPFQLGGRVPPPIPNIPGFRIVRELGQGGMGAVYLAQQETTGREVALKIMLPTIALHPRARDLFEREMKAIRLLDHPHIVRLHDTGSSAGMLYFTMEYCEGGSVRDRIKTGGPLAVDEAVRLADQALAALEHAHSLGTTREGEKPEGAIRGVVHRDLSPDNLFLSGNSVERICKVGDFGLATAIDRSGLSGHTHTGAMGGKPAYVCRQQVRGYRFARPEVDVWAVAACLYAMLTGTPPRDFPPGRDGWAIVLETMPVPIRHRRPDVPEGLAQLVDQALDDSGELAFKTASGFREALRQVLPQ